MEKRVVVVVVVVVIVGAVDFHSIERNEMASDTGKYLNK